MSFAASCLLIVAVSIGEAAKPRVFCYVDVAVSIGEGVVFSATYVAVSIGEAAKPRVFCYVDVAVSIGEAAKHCSCLLLRGCTRCVYRGSCKTSCLLGEAAWMSPCL